MYIVFCINNLNLQHEHRTPVNVLIFHPDIKKTFFNQDKQA